MILSLLAVFSIATVVVLIILFFFEPNLKYQVDKLKVFSDDAEFPELLSRATNSRIDLYNEAELLSGGAKFYHAELSAIASAKHSISIEVFIFHRGEIADRFLSVLIERAKAGVQARLIVDALGSFSVHDSYFDELRHAGAAFFWYQPFRWYNLKRLNNRTHREIVIIDGSVAFVGGAGIADHWLGGEGKEREWQDCMCKITGSIVTSFAATFAENWLEASGNILTDYCPDEKRQGDLSRRTGFVIRSTPSAARSTSSRVLFQLLIAAAKQSIVINSPYFLPDRSMREELKKAVRERGVSVDIILPGILSNHPTIRRLSRSYYGELISSGVKIFEYQPSMIHTKAKTVDDRWTVLGSTNFDSRSFGLNDEINFVSMDEGFAAECLRQFTRDKQQSSEITLSDWKQRVFPERYLAILDKFFERQD